MHKIFILFLMLTACSPARDKNNEKIYIRLNQIGFLNNDYKSAVILSEYELTGQKFVVYNFDNSEVVFSGEIGNNIGKYGSFNYSYDINFTQVRKSGRYAVKIGKYSSFEFQISPNIYSDFAPYLLEFFKVQRCGYTHPIMHKTCHIADVTEVIENGQQRNEKFDVTGGWHDAGDYTKFLNTTAFSTYLFLFAYDFSPEKFSFDLNNNSVPDILEEAKIGLDWLLRANYYDKKFITQVQNEKDQAVGWRMPEKDPLQFERPGFIGIGKNLVGIYVAALALGSRIWRDEIKYPEFSDKLLKTAMKFYSLKDTVPDVDSTGTGFYLDKHYEGKLALAAIELYNLQNDEKYLDDAIYYAKLAGTEAWWGWGNVAAFADYKIAKVKPQFVDFLKKSLIQFAKHSKKQTFGECVDLYWGSNLNLLGAPLINVLYKNLTSDNSFDKIAIINRDFILGRNPWGISFVYKKGKNYVKNFHHQIAYFHGGKLPGGLSGGPVMKSVYGDIEINYSTKDIYARFQTETCFFRDDRNDYVCNEPTISTNATAIFVFGLLK